MLHRIRRFFFFDCLNSITHKHQRKKKLKFYCMQIMNEIKSGEFQLRRGMIASAFNNFSAFLCVVPLVWRACNTMPSAVHNSYRLLDPQQIPIRTQTVFPISVHSNYYNPLNLFRTAVALGPQMPYRYKLCSKASISLSTYLELSQMRCSNLRSTKYLHLQCLKKLKNHFFPVFHKFR